MEKVSENFFHGGESREEAYRNFVAAIFKQAFDDLVRDLRRMNKEAAAIRRRTGTHSDIMEGHRKLRNASMSAKYNEEWIRQILPHWMDIDPEVIIKRAYEVAKDDS